MAQWEAWNSDRNINPKDFDYRDFTLSDGTKISVDGGTLPLAAVESHRRRLDGGTGQPSVGRRRDLRQRLRKDGKKAHPLSVHAVGGRYIFPSDREAEDHVYCMFEFPGPDYDPEFPVGYKDTINDVPDPEKGIPGYKQDPNKKVVVTYSSINGNGFGGYGEVVMGTKGTMVLAREQEVMLYAGSDTSSTVSVSSAKGGPTMDTQASGAAGADLEGRVDRAGQPRLHRGDRALGLVHPQRGPRESTAVPSGRGAGRRGDRPDHQRGHPPGRRKQGRLRASSRMPGTTSTTTPPRRQRRGGRIQPTGEDVLIHPA